MKSTITSIKPAKKIFTQKGKPVTKIQLRIQDTNKFSSQVKSKIDSPSEIYKRFNPHFFRKDESVTSLIDFAETANDIEMLTSIIELTSPKKPNLILMQMSSISVKKVLYTFTAVMLPLFAFFTFVNPVFSLSKPTPRYSIFSAKPLTVGGVSESLNSGDTRAAKLNAIFDIYNCSNFYGMGEVFVREADKNKIPYWLVTAVSFQESGCGNKTPTKDGNESYNAYGWGVWGDNVRTFNNWEEGIVVVSKYMNDMFYSKGTTDLCTIMKTYTPPSNGSWCNGVAYFRDIIVNYQSP